VFGGLRNRAVDIAYRLRDNATATVTVLRGRHVVRRFAARARRRNVTYRLRLASEKLRRGDYRVRLTVSEVGGSVSETLVTRRRGTTRRPPTAWRPGRSGATSGRP